MCYIYSKAIKRRHKRRLTLAEQVSRDNKFNAAVVSAPISSARRRFGLRRQSVAGRGGPLTNGEKALGALLGGRGVAAANL
jgi:hypothetical protein